MSSPWSLLWITGNYASQAGGITACYLGWIVASLRLLFMAALRRNCKYNALLVEPSPEHKLEGALPL